MAIGAVLEPLIVVGLLAFGTIVNRNKRYSRPGSRSPFSARRPEPWQHVKYIPDADDDDIETGQHQTDDESTLLPPNLSRSSSSSGSTLLADDAPDSKAPSRWRRRKLRFLGWEREVTTPNTEIFRDRLLSRVLLRLPFLVEVWYWALIYWVCPFPCPDLLHPSSFSHSPPPPLRCTNSGGPSRP